MSNTVTTAETPDINEMFNFDDFGASDSGNESASPATVSPNRTPPFFSSLDPFVDTSFDFDLPPSADFGGFDFFNGKPNAQAGPSSATLDAPIKDEPIDFGWDGRGLQFGSPVLGAQLPGQAAEQMGVPAIMPPAPATASATGTLGMNGLPLSPVVDTSAQAVPDFSSLPIEQQLALQQLMLNIMTYQQQFGADFAGAPPSNQATTIDPSQVFFNTPASTSASGGPSTGFASSSATPSLTTAASAPSVSVPTVSSTSQTAASGPASVIDDEDELVSIDSIPGQPRHRSMSTFSSLSNVDERVDRLAPLSSIFSHGRGKGGKKGGGLSSVVRAEDEDLDDDDSWRPSAEEYKKLSSKEKRQLRNKLSARAFRNRRKDYIGTLEGHIKERDMVIDDMRSELADSRSENQNLRRELEALKQSTMNVIHPPSASEQSEVPLMLSALALPRTLPTSSAGAGPSTPRKTVAPTPQFNPRKDLPTNGRSSGNMFGGPPTICHTILTPDMALPPRQNLNPRLSAEDRPTSMNLQQARPVTGDAIGNNTFAQWTDENPFSLRSMDSYRMQMWSRLAREAQADKAGLAGDMRPKFFVDSAAGRHAAPAASSASSDADNAATFTAAAQVAALATTHITTKLASSFLAAFSMSGSAAGGALDTDKLTDVVTGKARLRVVRDDEREQDREQEQLIAALGGLRLQAGPGLGMAGARGMGMGIGVGVGARGDPLGVIGGFLRHAAATAT